MAEKYVRCAGHCKYPAYDKEETDNLFRKKSDFAVIEGALTEWVFAEGYETTSCALSVNYPEGFSWDNCVVVSAEVNCFTDVLPHCYEYNSDTNDIYCQHSDDVFLFWIRHHGEAIRDWSNYKYRIVLMKIS